MAVYDDANNAGKQAMDAMGRPAGRRVVLQFFWPNTLKDGSSGVPKQHPIDLVICTLLSWLQARYFKISPAPQETNNSAAQPEDGVKMLPMAMGQVRRTEGLGSKLRQLNGLDKTRQEMREKAKKLDDHQAVKELLFNLAMDEVWPKDDKGMDSKPKLGTPRPKDQIVSTATQIQSMKRTWEGGEESDSKRPRNNA